MEKYAEVVYRCTLATDAKLNKLRITVAMQFLLFQSEINNKKKNIITIFYLTERFF